MATTTAPQPVTRELVLELVSRWEPRDNRGGRGGVDAEDWSEMLAGPVETLWDSHDMRPSEAEDVHRLVDDAMGRISAQLIAIIREEAVRVAAEFDALHPGALRKAAAA